MNDLPVNAIVQQEADASRRQPASGSERARLLFHFASEHFALVSAAALTVSLLGTTVFLYAYLRVFDWRLIWIIDYSDILKFGLVAFAIVSAWAYILAIYAENIYDWITVKEWTFGHRLALAITFFVVITNTLHNEVSDESHWAFHIFLSLSVGAVGVICAGYGKLLREGRNLFTVKNLSADTLMMIGVLALFGGALGYYVRDFGDKHDIALKGAAALQNVGVIMMTSRYIVLYREGHVTVVPSTELLTLDYLTARQKQTN